MLVPAAIFVVVNLGGAGVDGWAIPMATDIAFALAVLAIVGSKAPKELKLFLLTLAIVDDIGAIVVIALFYGDGIQPGWLLGAAATVGAIVVLRRAGVAHPAGTCCRAWSSGSAPSSPGSTPPSPGSSSGLLTPTGRVGGREVLTALEDGLHPWSSFVVVPIFALANAGVDLGGGVESARHRAGDLGRRRSGSSSASPWASAGRGSRCACGSGRCRPGVRAAARRRGAACSAGIGFTVSLFIAELAFDDVRPRSTTAKVGIFIGSITSGLLGTVILLTLGRRRAGKVSAGEDHCPRQVACVQDANGACSGYLVEDDRATHMLLDCGNGVFGKMRAHDEFVDVDGGRGLTHLHADHFLDLIPFAYALLYRASNRRRCTAGRARRRRRARACTARPARRTGVPSGAGAFNAQCLIEDAFEVFEEYVDQWMCWKLAPLSDSLSPRSTLRADSWAVEIVTTVTGGALHLRRRQRAVRRRPREFARTPSADARGNAASPGTDGIARPHHAGEAGEHARRAGARRLVVTHFADELGTRLGCVRRPSADFGDEVSGCTRRCNVHRVTAFSPLVSHHG